MNYEKFNSTDNISASHTTGSYSSEETNPMQQFQQMQNFQNFLSNKKDHNKMDDYTSYNNADDHQENISITSSKYKKQPPVILETIDGRKINMNEIHQQEFNFLTSSFTTGINSNSDLSVNKHDGKDNVNNNNHNQNNIEEDHDDTLEHIGKPHIQGEQR